MLVGKRFLSCFTSCCCWQTPFMCFLARKLYGVNKCGEKAEKLHSRHILFVALLLKQTKSTCIKMWAFPYIHPSIIRIPFAGYGAAGPHPATVGQRWVHPRGYLHTARSNFMRPINLRRMFLILGGNLSNKKTSSNGREKHTRQDPSQDLNKTQKWKISNHSIQRPTLMKFVFLAF